MGVQYTRDGKTSAVSADEVILAAGAIETPHLMMLSGLGDAASLAAAGITQIEQIPAVGRNLTDHPLIMNSVKLKPAVDEWDMRFPVELIYSSPAGRYANDMHVIANSGDVRAPEEMAKIPTDAKVQSIDAGILPMLYRPESVGSIELNPGDPAGPPRISFGYLRSADDRERLRHAERMLDDQILSHPGFEELVDVRDGFPGPAVLESDDALDAWAALNLVTTSHGCGTCAMGPASDENAVVDEQGRVGGVEGLRVADLSIVPRAPRSATNATAFVVGERIAAFID